MARTDLNALHVLATVAAESSFRKAARRLGVSASAVSHTVAALEERLGVRLLARTTRRIAPTEAGLRLLERTEPALADIDAALRAAAEDNDEASGTLRLTVPRSGAALFLMPILKDFGEAFPDVVLDILVEDGFSDLVAGRFDAGIRLGERLHQDTLAIRLDEGQRAAVVASPDYLDRFGRPAHPRELLLHRCIGRRFPSGELFRWEFERDGKPLNLSVGGPIILDDTNLIIAASMSGAGLACVFESEVAAALDTGSLERVLGDWCPAFDGFYLYHSSRKQVRPALRALIDFMRARESSVRGGVHLA